MALLKRKNVFVIGTNHHCLGDLSIDVISVFTMKNFVVFYCYKEYARSSAVLKCSSVESAGCDHLKFAHTCSFVCLLVPSLVCYFVMFWTFSKVKKTVQIKYQ